MRDGIYHIKFQANGASNFAEGLVVVKSLAFNGGDNNFLFTGKLQGNDHESSGRVSVKQWRAGDSSIFGTTGSFELDVEVTVEDTINLVRGVGTLVGNPAQKMNFTGKLVGAAA